VIEDETGQQSKRLGSRERILEEFIMMMQGSKFTQSELMSYYDATDRPIKLDFQIIRSMLKAHMPDYKIYNNRENKTYEIKSTEGRLQSEKVLAILKIIIGSRAFSREELDDLKDDLLDLVQVDQKADLKRLIAATINKYTPVAKSSQYDLMELIRIFAECISRQRKVEFTYLSSTGSNSKESHVGVPLNLYFDTYYFYVTVYLINNKKSYNYRLDRFQTVKPKRKTFNVPIDKKEDEGAAIKKTNLLKMGNDVQYKFRYWNYPQTALDRLQGSKVTKRFPDGSVIIEGEIYAEGAKLWILSQGANIKVLAPQSLVDQVKEQLRDTLSLYK